MDKIYQKRWLSLPRSDYKRPWLLSCFRTLLWHSSFACFEQASCPVENSTRQVACPTTLKGLNPANGPMSELGNGSSPSWALRWLPPWPSPDYSLWKTLSQRTQLEALDWIPEAQKQWDCKCHFKPLNFKLKNLPIYMSFFFFFFFKVELIARFWRWIVVLAAYS